MSASIEYIQKLDLSYISYRLVSVLHWEPDDAAEAVRKYKNYLILSYLHPEARLVPTPEIDEAWHAHILHTENYMRDCEQIFGKYRHHAPSSGLEEDANEEDLAQTLVLYEKHFQELYVHRPNAAEWVSQYLSGGYSSFFR